MTSSITDKTLRGGLVALAVGLALVAGGCSARGAEDSGGAAADSSANLSSDGEAAAPERSAAAVKVDVADLTGAQQVRTAQVTLEVSKIGEGSAKVRGIATALGGVVQDENSTFDSDDSDPSGGGSSVITLRVPVDKLDQAIAQLDDVGRRADLRTSSEDVTASVADLDSRVLSQQKSVERMRVLLAEADSVKDVIAIESELSTREANLESLQAQAASLKGRAALSTLVVTLERPATADEPDDDTGFLAGLGTGWDALKDGTVAALTVIGVLLPIGVVLALVLVPLWFVYRRFRSSPA